MNFDDSQTKINLARAFSAECQDGARYQFISQKAVSEGKQNVSTFFKSLAKNEMAHAKTFWTLMSQHLSKPQRNIEIRRVILSRTGA